jgi:hypothetical protein
MTCERSGSRTSPVRTWSSMGSSGEVKVTPECQPSMNLAWKRSRARRAITSLVEAPVVAARVPAT